VAVFVGAMVLASAWILLVTSPAPEAAVAVAPSASPAPSESAAPTGEVAEATLVPPSPIVPETDRVLDAFFTGIAKPGPAYHVTATGHSVGPGLDVPFTLDLDVSGDDFKGTNDARRDGSGFADVTRVEEVSYVRPKGGAWGPPRSGDTDLRLFPFLGIEGRNDLVHAEAFEQDGETLHRFVTTKYYQPNVGRLLDLAAFRLKPDLLHMELIMTEDGIPVWATLRVEAGGRTSGDAPVFLGRATYRYSAWGTATEITAP
jgi:hypothetical protein